MAQVAQTARISQNTMIRQYTIYDDAMAPTVPRGSIVLAREYNTTRFVEWGEIYMIETDDGPILARLTPGKDEDHYLCERDNPEKRFATINMPKSEIRGIFRVVAMAKFM